VARRGAVKVQEIRAVLDQLDLVTEPDFETEWIDAPIWLKLKSGVDVTVNVTADAPPAPPSLEDVEEIVLEGTPSAVKLAEEQTESAPTSAQPESSSIIVQADGPTGDDPTYRIGSLPAANKKLVTVSQNDSLVKAVTLMLQYDFSQLPVMQGDREVKGVVTWKAIGAKLALGTQCVSVGDCREDAKVVDSNRTLFDAIPTIVEHGYVLVRAGDRRITGIVTASDLSLQFQALAEPFLLLREIELHVRQLLSGRVVAADFDLLDAPNPIARKPQNIADLTFGEYVRLFQHPQVWPKLDLKIDGGVLTGLLEEIRQIRNDVMHFDPDPMTEDELKTLKRAVHLLQQLYEIIP
jgi:CBS domain-containing protein